MRYPVRETQMKHERKACDSNRSSAAVGVYVHSELGKEVRQGRDDGGSGTLTLVVFPGMKFMTQKNPSRKMPNVYH